MWTYGQVEHALASLHEIPPSGMGAFRGRIRNFQRLGLVPTTPGKGKTIQYGRDFVFLWAFALELSSFAMAPVVIKAIMDIVRNALLSVVQGGSGEYWMGRGDGGEWGVKATLAVDADGGQGLYFFFHPRLLGHDAPTDVKEMSTQQGVPYRLYWKIVRDLKELKAQKHPDTLWSRYAVIDLARLLTGVDAALSQIEKR